MYIDTHCHLTFQDFDEDRAAVIGNAKKAGVKQFIVPGVDFSSSQQAVELAQKNKHSVFAAIGFHPYEAQSIPDVFILDKILKQVQGDTPTTVVAIGECGLDYHVYKGEKASGKKTNQIRLFQEQIELALKYDLPLIMHCRDAFDDFFDTIDACTTNPKGVIHCFSGGLHHIRMAQERGLYIGLDGNITYSKHLQSILPNITLDNLLLETDAPYLTPAPHRGTRNEPKYIPLIAKYVAEVKNINTQDVAEKTTHNAQTLFSLPN